MTETFDITGSAPDGSTITGTITIGDPPAVNLLQSPDDLSASPWTQNSCTATFVSADAATKVIENTVLTWHYVSQTVTQSGSNKSYVLSAKVKSLGRGVALQISTATGECSATFNLTGSGTPKVSSTSGSGVTLVNKSIAPADADGYYTVSIDVTVANAAPSINAVLLVGIDTGTRYQGGGTLGFEAKNTSLLVQ